jgi:hypothetical protein
MEDGRCTIANVHVDVSPSADVFWRYEFALSCDRSTARPLISLVSCVTTEDALARSFPVNDESVHEVVVDASDADLTSSHNIHPDLLIGSGAADVMLAGFTILDLSKTL